MRKRKRKGKQILEQKILVLNASYEPFQLMPVKKAIRKLSKDEPTLEVVQWSEQTIRSGTAEFKVPSVVRVTYYINIQAHRDKSGAKRMKIYIRDRWKCAYCQRKLLKYKIPITLDHIIPKSRGGSNTPENLVTSCKPCNNKKGDRTPAEAKMTLHVPKSVLRSHIDVLNIRSLHEKHPEWADYLFWGKGDTNLMHSE